MVAAQHSHLQEAYKNLGLTPDTTDEQVRRVYFTLIQQYSPDHKPDMFKRIRASYELIRAQQNKRPADFLPYLPSCAGEFEELPGALYNIAEDIVDIELYHLIRSPKA